MLALRRPVGRPVGHEHEHEHDYGDVYFYRAGPCDVPAYGSAIANVRKRRRRCGARRVKERVENRGELTRRVFNRHVGPAAHARVLPPLRLVVRLRVFCGTETRVAASAVRIAHCPSPIAIAIPMSKRCA